MSEEMMRGEGGEKKMG